MPNKRITIAKQGGGNAGSPGGGNKGNKGGKGGGKGGNLKPREGD